MPNNTNYAHVQSVLAFSAGTNLAMKAFNYFSFLFAEKKSCICAIIEL